MKLLWLFTLFTFTAIAQNDPNFQEIEGIGEDAQKVVVYENLRKVKNQEVDSYLLDNPLMKKCKDQHMPNGEAGLTDDSARQTVSENIQKCFMQEMDNLSDTQIEELGDSLNLDGYGVIKDKSVGSIKNYFEQRLSENLYGKISDPKAWKMGKMREQKFVDHEKFYEIYQNQLGKNMLTDLSAFCLEKVELVSDWKKKCVDSQNPEQPKPSADCLQKISNKDDNVKRAKAKLAGKDPKELKLEWFVCVMSVDLACKEYKKTSDSEISLSDKHDTDVGTDADKKKVYREACIVVDRIKSYRKSIKHLAETREEMKDLNKGAGANLGDTFKGAYSGKGGGSDKSINELTTVSSNLVHKNYDYEQELDNAKKCFDDGNPESQACIEFYKKDADITEEKQQKLLLDLELKTAAQIKLLKKKIGDLDNQEMEEYLKENGYTAQAQALADKPGTLDQVKMDLYSAQKAEKLAIIKEMNERLEKLEIKKDDTDPTAELTEMQQQVEKKENKLRGIYHYSNIVTGYLDVEGGQSNTQSVLIEGEDSDIDDTDSYLSSYVNEAETMGSTTAASDNSVVDLNFIDQLLNKTEKNPPAATP